MTPAANAILIKRLNSFEFTGVINLGEDAARTGFNNLTLGSDSFVLNPRFDFSTDYRINARSGHDVIGTSAGDDIIYGGSGNDRLNAGKGADDVFGGSGNDTIFGGAHQDDIQGGSGVDVIDGGADRDMISGGRGDDALTGGSGSDVFIFHTGDGVDRITDFTQGQDLIALGAEILRVLPDTFQGAYDVAAALINVDHQGDFTIISGQFNSTEQLIFDIDTRILSFDADGSAGPGEAVDLMHLESVARLQASDFWAPAAF
jgi:Ca2+-binding RTX toxin-like protein